MFIYALGQPDSTLVKIGQATDPVSRLRTIRALSPVPLNLLACWKASPRTGAALHSHFADRRRHGEWFEFDDLDPVEAINEYLATEPVVPPSPRQNTSGVAVHGPTLRFVRELLGVSTAQLAATLECSRSYLTKLELGHSRACSPAFLTRLVAELNIPDRRVLLIDPYDDEPAAEIVIPEQATAPEQTTALEQATAPGQATL